MNSMSTARWRRIGLSTALALAIAACGNASDEGSAPSPSPTGLERVCPELIDVTRVYCASEWQRIKTLILPGALPFIFTGLYVAVGAAILGMVLAELLVVIRGLGGIIVRGSSAYRPEQVFVALFAMIVESLLFTSFIVWLRRRIMPWERLNS